MHAEFSMNRVRKALTEKGDDLDGFLDRLVEARDAEDPAIWIHCLSRDELQEYADRIRGQKHLPLYGVPFAIKDNIDLEGAPTTAGCPAYAYEAETSATVVARLIRAGAIPVGKTNLDQFATGLVGVRSPYGVPRNAMQGNLVPGGSSSGSAVAVAKGLVSFALGTDTAGSGRVPAALNNVVGLKPSCGVLSTTGVVPACRTLDCVSIFAGSAAEAFAVFQIAKSFDFEDPYSQPSAGVTPCSVGRTSPRVAIPRAEDLEFFGHADSERAFAKSVGRMEALGWHVTEVDFRPFLEVARWLYEGPWVAERYAAIRDFFEAQPEALHPVTRAIIERGRQLKAVDTFETFYALEHRRRELETFWRSYDLLVTPTVGRPYFLDDVEEEPYQFNTNLGHYTNFMNLLRMCAVATPSSMLPGGVPFGITLSGPADRDESVLAWADDYHRETGLAIGATGVPVQAMPSLHHIGGRSHCQLAVCGAHLEGLPLHHQLSDLGAVLLRRTTTAPCYRLFALPNTEPAKPGLWRSDDGRGGPIEIEVYGLTPENFGKFVAAVPSPLTIGRIETVAGDFVSGFLCESFALQGAREITEFGSWKTYLAEGAPVGTTAES